MLNIIENFPILFDSKEKVKELRNFILSLAIQGKLVPQDPSDEPARVLLQRIEAEKKRLVKEKTIKKTKSLPPIGEDEIPFEIPEGWEWTRLGTISNYGISETVVSEKIQDTEWVLELEDIEKESSIVVQRVLNAKRKSKSNKNRFYTGDILYGKLRPYLKKVLVAEEPGVCTTEIIPFRGYDDIVSKYIMYYLKSPYIDSYVNSITHGMSMPRLGTDKARMLLFSLPPLTEQHRIVQKVDELMALCDELEKALEKKAQSNELASKSISNLIHKSENQEQLKANLTLLINMFKEVYSTKANIKDLRDTILQLAIQGKLVPQDPNDEPANVLLKQIEEEKEQLVKEKKIKKATSLPPISEEEKPFDLPKGWEWVRLGRIVHIVRGSSPRPKGLPIYFSQEPTNYNWITIWDITNKNKNNVLIGTKEYLTEEGSMKSRHMSLGEIIIAVSGSVGKSCILGIEGYIYDGLAGLKYISNDTLRDYLSVYLKSWESNLNNMSEGTSWPNINTDILNSLVIPLPPKEEQRRIVQKVDEFMALCDELEKHIEATVHHSDNLMKSIIKTAI
ncbi:MAG: restriction endonuclease subunit S [Desulfitobacteriaceae bacterium]|nr:restriction endonuclease subunit S [Desulfitobacteriaceae bacterium]